MASQNLLPNPVPYPGKFNKNNKGGTLKSKSEWKLQETRKWYNEMSKSADYDDTPFYNRSRNFKTWMDRKMSITEAKQLLIEVESESMQANGGAAELENDEFGEANDDPMDVSVEDLNDSVDMFEEFERGIEDNPKSTRKEMTIEKEDTIQKFLSLSDSEILDRDDIPKFVQKDMRFIEKTEKLVQDFVDTNYESSQDILDQMTQIPRYIRDHEALQTKIKHLSKTEMSERRIVKNLRETLSELRKDSSREAFNDRVKIVASVVDHRYGEPDLGETRNVYEAAIKLKVEFTGGIKTTLEPARKNAPEHYPPEVFKLAEESWLNRSTTPDPAKHARPQKALRDGKETVPSVYQMVTDDEAYAQFKDNDEERVKQAMQKSCEALRRKYQNRPDSETKRKTFETLARKENKFPGKTWFLARKPPQTKILDDHTTALCKDCNSAQMNYETIYKMRKKFCQCRTNSCPNWICACEEDNCECTHPCACDDCSGCQVIILNFFYLFFLSNWIL